MATGWKPIGLTDEERADGEAYHRALYHDAALDRPAGWHRDSCAQLLELARPHLEDGALVVAYGSGAGGSAIELLKLLGKVSKELDRILCAEGHENKSGSGSSGGGDDSDGGDTPTSAAGE